MKESEILSFLTAIEFVNTGKKGWSGHSRIIHPKIKKGSLYIGDQYISATGEYANIKKVITQSSFCHNGYPVWQNSKTKILLDFIVIWMNET